MGTKSPSQHLASVMKGINVPKSQLMEEGNKYLHCAYSCQLLVQVLCLFFIYFLKYAVACCTRLLLLHSSLVMNETRWQVGGMGGTIRGRYDGEWWMGCHGDEGRACHVSTGLHSET